MAQYNLIEKDTNSAPFLPLKDSIHEEIKQNDNLTRYKIISLSKHCFYYLVYSNVSSQYGDFPLFLLELDLSVWGNGWRGQTNI